MIDRTTKLLLAAIAIGLFLNALTPLFKPGNDFSRILESLKNSGSEVQVRVEVKDGEESTIEIEESHIDDDKPQ